MSVPAATRTGTAVVRGGLANLAGAAVAGLAGFGVTWLVARGLGPAAAGGFFAATSAFTLAGTVAKLGTPTGLVYFLARLRAQGAPEAALRRCLRVGLGPVLVAAALAGAGMWATAPWLAARTGHHAPGYLAQLRVLAVFLPVAVLFDTLLAATRGWRRMRPTVLLDKLLRPALQLAAVGLLALVASRPAGDRAVPTSHAAAGYALAWAAPYAVTAVLAGHALRKLAPRRGRNPAAVPTRMHFWKFTGPRAVASVAQLALQRVDVLLVASLAGLRAAAVYAVAGRFVVLGQLANQALLTAVQPRLAELLGAGDRAGAKALYQQATGWLVRATWPLYLGTAVFAPAYLGLFGHVYRGAGTVVVVLAFAMLVATGCGTVDTVLAMAGRTSWNLANVGLALGVTLGVDLALVPHLGALGAALGFAAAALTNNLVPLAQIALSLGLHPFGRATAAAALTATGCFGAVPLAVRALAGAGLGSALLAAALGAAGYAVVLARTLRPGRRDPRPPWPRSVPSMMRTHR